MDDEDDRGGGGEFFDTVSVNSSVFGGGLGRRLLGNSTSGGLSSSRNTVYYSAVDLGPPLGEDMDLEMADLIYDDPTSSSPAAAHTKVCSSDVSASKDVKTYTQWRDRVFHIYYYLVCIVVLLVILATAAASHACNNNKRTHASRSHAEVC